jgi:hypothetical protein
MTRAGTGAEFFQKVTTMERGLYVAYTVFEGDRQSPVRQAIVSVSVPEVGEPSLSAADLDTIEDTVLEIARRTNPQAELPVIVNTLWLRDDPAAMETEKPYTVLLMNLDRTASILIRTMAQDPRSAYEKALRQIYDGTGLDPDEDPFDLAQAERDRPLLHVFSGFPRDLTA